jgi:hypothetical protein
MFRRITHHHQRASRQDSVQLTKTEVLNSIITAANVYHMIYVLKMAQMLLKYSIKNHKTVKQYSNYIINACP